MAYSDSKHDDNMEAGLLSTHQEERMSKEALFQDSEFNPSTTNHSRSTSPARRVLMAFGICLLLAIGLVSIGSATGMGCGHLRNGDLSIKDAVHRHNPNLSHAMEHMAKRQNTPIPGSSTTEATQPSATSDSTSENGSTTSAAAPTTTQDNNPTTTRASESSSAEETQPSQTQDTTQADSTTDSGTSTEETVSQTSSSPSETSESIASASISASSTSASDASSTSLPSSTESIGTSDTLSSSESTESSVKTSTSGDSTTAEATQSTITTGTKTTSSAVARVFTSTLSDGGVTTLTSTSWVAVVPSSESTTAGSPSLQNTASQHSIHSVLVAAIGMVFGGLIML